MKAAHRRAHLRVWIALAVLIGIGIGAGLALRQPVPVEPRHGELQSLKRTLQ